MTIATQHTDQRGLRRMRAVVLNADIADYSRHMADDDAATVATVRYYHGLVSRAVDAGGGTLVNFVGDSFLAVFDDAKAAMQTAIAICGAVAERNRGLPRTRRMWFRLGLDIGDIVVADDGRHFGEALNVAARIQEIAEVGGINVTEEVYRKLDEPALRLIGIGPRRLKNIPEMIRVYRLAGVAGDSDDRPQRWLGPTRPSVALMPVIGADEPAVRDIAHGLRLELTAALGRIPGLHVIDVAASGAPRDRQVDLGADLGAAHLLITGLARSGTRLRAYAEVVETATMNRVWAQRWQGTSDDVFALQDAVTAGTVRALEIELVVGEPARIYRTDLDGNAVWAVYEGWRQLITGTAHGWRKAVELFTSVAESRPDRASGSAVAAFALWWGASRGLSDDPDADRDRAAAFARRGIALGDDTGLSPMVIAALQLHAGGDLDAALARAQVAIAQRPTCDVSFAVAGSVHRYLGAWEAAVDACRRAMELSPMRKPWYATVLASAYYVGERYHDAVETAEHIVHRYPDSADPETLLILAAAQQALGLTRRAQATADTIRDRFPGLRREDLRHRHPFREPAVLERWLGHLAAAGVP